MKQSGAVLWCAGADVGVGAEHPACRVDYALGALEWSVCVCRGAGR